MMCDAQINVISISVIWIIQYFFVVRTEEVIAYSSLDMRIIMDQI